MTLSKLKLTFHTWIMMIRPYLIIGAILNAPLFATANDYYISPGGNDTTGAGSEQLPWQTVTHALTQIEGIAEIQNTIFLDAGLYSPGSTGEKFPIRLKSHMSLIGIGIDSTILDAEALDYDLNSVIYCYGVQEVEISNLTITGGYGSLSELNVSIGGGLHIDSSANIIIHGNRITKNEASNNMGGHAYGGGISVLNSSDVIIYNNIIDSCSTGADGGFGGGLAVYGSVMVLDNLIYDNVAVGIRGFGGGIYADGGVLICGNDILGNEADFGGGIIAGETTIIRNNILHNKYGAIRVTNQNTLIGGSEGNGNNIIGNWIDTEFMDQLNRPINARYNYFGAEAGVHPAAVFDVEPMSEDTVRFKVDRFIAMPPVLQFDSVSIGVTDTMYIKMACLYHPDSGGTQILEALTTDDRFRIIAFDSFVGNGQFGKLAIVYSRIDTNAVSAQCILRSTSGTVAIDLVVNGQPVLRLPDSQDDTDPNAIALISNHPNPCNSETVIRLILPKTESVVLKIIDLRGREVHRLINGTVLGAGVYRFRWNTDSYASGIYFLSLIRGEEIITHTISVLK